LISERHRQVFQHGRRTQFRLGLCDGSVSYRPIPIREARYHLIPAASQLSQDIPSNFFMCLHMLRGMYPP
jgi:hypothetical protein